MNEDGLKFIDVRKPGKDFEPMLLFRIEDLESILTHGYRGRFQNHHNQGSVYFEKRDEIELYLWGTTDICYGFSRIHGFYDPSYYGDSILVLKKTRIRCRATVCNGDSLNELCGSSSHDLRYMEMQIKGKVYPEDIKFAVISMHNCTEAVKLLLKKYNVRYRVVSSRDDIICWARKEGEL
jgi:hypothetical protein